jgi:hypothetical protein
MTRLLRPPLTRTTALLLLLAAIGSLTLLVAALPGLVLTGGFEYDLVTGPIRGGSAYRLPGWVLALFLLFPALAALGLVVVIFFPAEAREKLRVTPAQRILLIGLAVFSAFVYWRLYLRAAERMPPLEEVVVAEGPAYDQILAPGEFAASGEVVPLDQVAHMPLWLTLLLVTAATAVLLLSGMSLWRRFGAQPVESDPLAREARQALDDLAAGADLRHVIIACYVAMTEIVARERGLSRHHSMTAREFEGALAARQVPITPVQRLTRLFEQVRYSPEEPGARAELEARSCLADLVAVLERPHLAGEGEA